jgi:alpha-ketoglutarate-dependent 2,4-dichlorophenoxyacetate dioxygenase
VIPEDGDETRFAYLRAAYDALSERTKQRLDGLIAEHSLLYSRGTLGFTDFTEEEKQRLGSAPQPMVRVHPGSRRKTLYLASHAMMIHGMEVPEGRILLKEPMDHATRPEFVHTHRWIAGEVVPWENSFRNDRQAISTTYR